LGVQGRRRFEVSVQSTVAALHGAFGVSVKQIRRLLQELWGLRSSDGEMVALLEGVAQAESVRAGELALNRLQRRRLRVHLEARLEALARPAVTAPKVSGGTRSEKGSQTKMGLLSLMGTWTLQNRALLPACRKLLLTGSPA